MSIIMFLLEGRQKKKTLLRKQKMMQAMIDFQKFSHFQSQSRLEQEKDMETLLSTFTEEIESQQDLDFFQDDNNVPKKTQSKKSTAKSNYSNTNVKARNLLTNVSYRRFKQKDFNNVSSIIDILSFIVQNFTPISLDRKLDDEKEKIMVKYLWDECIPHNFIPFIYKSENHVVLSNPKLTYQKAMES